MRISTKVKSLSFLAWEWEHWGLNLPLSHSERELYQLSHNPISAYMSQAFVAYIGVALRQNINTTQICGLLRGNDDKVSWCDGMKAVVYCLITQRNATT